MSTSNERVKDGVAEHRHIGSDYLDYWHPIARVHKDEDQLTSPPDQILWPVSVDDVYDIIYAMSGIQFRYVDSCGDAADILDADYMIQKHLIRHRFFSAAWVFNAAGIGGIKTEIRSRVWGKIASRVFESSFGTVEFIGGTSKFVRGTGYDLGETVLTGCIAKFEEGSMLHKAKLLLESGEAAKYITAPNLGDALHVLYVQAGGSYYDLIRLLNGGHIPPEILHEKYGVSWDDLAKIPLGKPRDGETFACPICGEKSFFAGVCRDCVDGIEDPCRTCRLWDECGRESDPCNELLLADKANDLIFAAEDARTARKEFEHGVISRMIKSGNWKGCRYVRGGD